MPTFTFLPEAQQLVLGAWALAAATLLGLGLLERRLFGPPLTGGRDLWLSFWMGFALLLAGLQAWHLFLPVDTLARSVVVATGLLGWLVSGLAPWRVLGRALGRNLVGLLALVATTWWLSNRALAGPTFGDTGLYLVPAVHWVESFAIVPGLANLYVPLGHNNTYFLYAAFMDAGPFAGRFFHIVNSLLVLALLARGLMACGSLLRRRPDQEPDQGRAGDMFYALALVSTVELAFTLYLGSPMPDTAVFLFGLVLAGQLVELASTHEPARSALLRLVFLCGAGVTVKLSLAATALTVAATATLLWLWRRAGSFAEVLGTAALVLLAGLATNALWLVRSVIMSGLPFYPAQILPFPVDWICRVDATAWVQKPMAMAPLHTIFTDPAWWNVRLDSLGWYDTSVLRVLGVMAVAFVVFVLARSLHLWRGRKALVPLAVLAVPVASFFFAFLTTPMPRYQGATLWIFAIDFVVLSLAWSGQGGSQAASRAASRLLVVALAVTGTTLEFVRADEAVLPLRDFQGTSRPIVEQEKLASGLVVGLPLNQVCWWAPLPCSPEIHPGLKLRDPDDLGAGFRIDAEDAELPFIESQRR